MVQLVKQAALRPQEGAPLERRIFEAIDPEAEIVMIGEASHGTDVSPGCSLAAGSCSWGNIASGNFIELFVSCCARRPYLLHRPSTAAPAQEFYRVRAEVTKLLIQERGFSAVVAEADFPDAFRVNM